MKVFYVLPFVFPLYLENLNIGYSLYMTFLLMKYHVMRIILFYVQVRGGQLWGTDVYTYDSDLVAGMCLVSTQK